MAEHARLIIAVDSTQVKRSTDDLRGLAAESRKAEGAAGGLASAMRPLVGIFATLKVGQLVKETTMLASRYGELGIVMEVVGRNAGYSRAELDSLEEGLKRTGISAIESRNNIARMISANIDLAKATELARLAQDAAVIGGLNSSDAFQRLVRGIQTAEIETLRNIGLNVSFERSYEELAQQLGKTASELTELEKVQARTNGVLQAAPNIAGAYEASLDNAGKALRSSTRYLEDFQVKLGEATQPAFAKGVEAYSNSLKFLSQNVDGVIQVLETGLYVALARGATAITTSTTAMVMQAAQQAKSNQLTAQAAAFEVRKAEAAKVSALAELNKARATEAAAIATLAQTRADQQRFAMQVALARGTAEYAALSSGLAAVNRNLAASEQAVAAATSARAAAAATAAGATAALGKASAAATAANTAAAASSATLAGAMRVVTGVGGRLLGLLGGPVGLLFTVGAVALSFVDFSDKADGAKRSTDGLNDSLTRLRTTAEIAEQRFAGATANIGRMNKGEVERVTERLQLVLRREEQDLKRFQRLYEAGNKGITRGLIQQKEDNITAIKGQLEVLGAASAEQENASTKEGEAYIKRLTEQRALLGTVTEEEKIRAQIREGLIKVSPAEQERLLILAREIDAQRALEEGDDRRKRSLESLNSSYRSVAANLHRELNLHEDAGEVAKLRYEIENGNLQGLASKQILYLEGLARELDAKRDLTEQEQRRIEILRESGQIRAANDAQFELEYAAKIAEYERQGNQEALQRLETLRRIRDIQLAADQAPGTVEGVSQAPRGQGIDAMFGSSTGELLKLQEQAAELEAWRQTELEKQQGFLEAKAINEEVYAERVRNIHQQHQAELSNLEQARTQVSLAASERMFGSLASMAATFAGEQSGIYRAMFAVQKAAAIAQSIIAIQQGIAMAAANPWPMNIGAMASVAAATAGIVSNISSVNFAGAFDKGGTIPSGQWGIVGEYGPEIVRGPAMVTSRTDTARALSGNSTRGGGGAAPIINISAPVTVEAQPGASAEDAQQYGRELASAMTANFLHNVERESRQGGLLWNLYGGGR